MTETKDILLVCLAAVTSGFLMAVVAVLVGGFLVYKTKREDGEVFRKPVKQEVNDTPFNIDDGFEQFEDEGEEIPEVVMKRNQRFADQFAERILQKGEVNAK